MKRCRIAACRPDRSRQDGGIPRRRALVEHCDDIGATLPDPQELEVRRRRLGFLLSRWQLLLAIPRRQVGLLMLANLQPPRPGDPPQRLLGICRQAADLHRLVPADGSDVLVLARDFLRDGPALPALAALLRRDHPPTVLLSLGTPHRVAVRAAREAGVQALISQESVGEGGLLEALRGLASGQPFLDAACRAVLEARTPASHELTARELQILALVAEGCTNRVIADRLRIAEVTARDHVQRILSKLQVADRTAAAVAGLRLGYLP